MKERKEICIEEVEGGYIVKLEYAWQNNRPDDQKAPEDSVHVTPTLAKALSIAKKHLRKTLKD